MTGSLQIKNGKYYAVINLYENGKRKPKWVSLGLDVKCSKKEREKKLREVLTEYENNAQPVKSDILFCDYLKVWLKEKKLGVDRVSFQYYEAEINTHIYPYFKKSGVKLVELNRDMLQQYIIEKHENGRKDGKGGLSAPTLKRHKNYIKQTLDLAVRNGLIQHNPCEYITLPQIERCNYDFFTLEEINAFLNAIKSERLYPLYVVTATYGLRRSEVLGIKWDSIDLENRMLTIKHTRVMANDVVEKDKTKNQSSYRSFPLTDNMIDLFVKLKNDEQKNKRLFGNDYIKSSYVFKWENGEPYSPSYITHAHGKILKKYGFRHIRFHDLRHSCASLLNAQGFTLKDIQEWLGHADIQTTANIYSHLDIKRKVNISETLSSVIHKC